MPNLFPLKKLLERNKQATLEQFSKYPNLDRFHVHSIRSKPSRNLTLQLKKSIQSRTISRTSIRTSSLPRCSTFNSQEYLDEHSEISNCLMAILNDSIDQIHILSGGKQTDNIIEHLSYSLEESIAKGFIDDPIFDQKTGISYPVTFAKQKTQKVLADSAKIKEFLILIRNDIKEDKNYRSIRFIMNNIIRKKREQDNLLTNERRNYKTLRDFKQLLINQSREYQKDMQNLNESLGISKDKSQDLLFENLIRTRYITGWENARNEQNNKLCERGERDLELNIAKCQYDIDQELRINFEIEMYLVENLNDLRDQISYWTKRHTEEIEERNIQLQILKGQQEDIQTWYKEMLEIYTLHLKQIRHYLAFREQRRKESEERERKRQAAIKIQAWWRGMMVRHKLGPYNPRKRKKKKKGKKGRKK